MSKQNFNESIMIQIIREIHIIDDLRINMFIEINIQTSENMIIDIFRRQLTIINCVEFTIVIEIINSNKRINRIFKNKTSIFLSLHSVINVFIQVRENSALSTSRDYMFHFEVSFNLK